MACPAKKAGRELIKEVLRPQRSKYITAFVLKIKIRQCKYLNNMGEQDHRFIKWKIQNGLGFKKFKSSRRTLGGIEVVHRLRKNQMIGIWDNYV